MSGLFTSHPLPKVLKRGLIYDELEHDSRSVRTGGLERGKRSVLGVSTLEQLADTRRVQASTEWVRLRSAWLEQVLPDTRSQFPCAATSSKVLRTIDLEQVNQLLMELLTRARADRWVAGEQMHVVLDGKTVRGTQGHLAADQQRHHHLNLYEATQALSSNNGWWPTKQTN